MMREAAPADRAALLAFLRSHESSSMFPLVNLTTVSGVPTRAWVAGENTQVTGFLGLTETGFVMPQLPFGDWPQAAKALSGSRIGGLIGPAEQVQALKRALDLDPEDLVHDRQEPGFVLSLADLQPPDAKGCTLRCLAEADLPTVIPWRVAYNAETFGQPDDAFDTATREVGAWLKRDSHRVLWQGDRPVALTGFNARLPEVVQIGGVYVPPDLRSQGHARRAVALHLAEARGEGVRRAVLFAASAPAERAYRAIGFQPSGRMSIVLLKSPKVLP